MGSRYLTDLADVVRATGLEVQEEPGWQTRARGSGGYSSGLPNHVMIHHTASGPSSDGQPDVSYMCYTADAKPVANLYLARSGKVWVMAAGATNTNGSGGDPCGTIANDTMNESAIGIEAGNNGTGEIWPDAQQDAYVALVAQLCGHYAIDVTRVHSHAEWAPGRKIDPAGPSRWAASGTWDEAAFRADVATGGTPPPERKLIRMYSIAYCEDTLWPTWWASDSIHARWLQTNQALDQYRSMLTVFGFTTDPTYVSSANIQSGMIGQPIGRAPWDYYGQRDVIALAVWELQFAYPSAEVAPWGPAWAHLGATEQAALDLADRPAGDTPAAANLTEAPTGGKPPKAPPNLPKPHDATT